MNRVTFKQGLHFWLQHREYIIQEKRADGNLRIADVITNEISLLSEMQLMQFFLLGELEFDTNSSITKLKTYQGADFSQIPEHLKIEAQRKENYIKEVLKQKIYTYTKSSLTPIIQQVSQKIGDDKPPSTTTLYRWLKDYTSSDGDIRALVPRYRARGNFYTKINPELHCLIDEVITEVYLTPERPSIARIYDVLICRIVHENNLRKSLGQELLDIPHPSTIYRLIKNLDSIDKTVSRYGKRTASLIYDPVQLGPKITRPLERVEIDHTKLPFFVVDTQTRIPIGTPSLTSAVDKYSGAIVGYYLSFEPFSYLSVMQCLINSIQKKDYVKVQFPEIKNSWDTYGIMEILVVDNGKEFYSKSFQDACQQLGITIQYTPPRMPWYKSTVERTFGSYNTKLLTGQPGNLFQEFTSQYDYDPRKNAVVSLSALQEMIHTFIIDIYNQSSHPQYKCSRSEVWTKGAAEFPIKLPVSNQDLRILVGAIEKRVISKSGIEFLGLYYNSSELVHLRTKYGKEDLRRKGGKGEKEKATIKYDPTDLSKIYVLDPDKCQFILVPAVNQEYTQGLTVWQHKVIKNLAAIESSKIDIIALALAKQRIQEIVEREWQKSHKGKTRQSMARWLGIGRESFEGDDISALNSQTTNSSSSQNKDSEQGFEKLFNTDGVIKGISDIGSALTVSVELDTTVTEQVSQPVEITPDLSQEQLKKSKTKRHKKSDSHPRAADSLQPDNSMSKNDDWEPNLSGWDVSYGLPK